MACFLNPKTIPFVKEAGMCPAMDEVVIEDGDAFTFKLISSFE